MTEQPPSLFDVDEIHRFNRAQQDSFLPYVEDGTIVLVGKGYQYDPDTDTRLLRRANYLPDGLPRETFYEPTTSGYERAISERLRHCAQLRNDQPGAATTPPEDN